MASHKVRGAVPSTMRVGVGSTNPVKRGATEDALQPVAGTTVDAVAVDSGVSEQPTGHRETLRGAETRARRAHAAGAYGLGVGVEGGVAEFPWAPAVGGPASGDAENVAPTDAENGASGRAQNGAPGEADDGPTGAGLYLVMWAAATDGETVGHGAGPSLRLPERVAERVRAGEELGPVMDDVFDLTNVAENEGAAGVLTGRAIDRRSALAHAVAGALGPFVTDCYGE